MPVHSGAKCFNQRVMSKAFVKERDDEDEGELPPLPPGGRNYMTPEGWRRLADEREHLSKIERPKIVETVSWAASNGDRSENGDYLYGKKRLREIDRRLRYLAKRLESAVVVNPANQPNKAQVFFGATVTYVDDADVERTVKIVGQDEVDPARGHVSWVSPVARALMKARLGDVVTLVTPRGPVEVEVLDIRYDS